MQFVPESSRIWSADIMLPIPINYLREQSHESLQADQEQLLLVERLLVPMLLRLLLVLLRLSGALPLAGALSIMFFFNFRR